MNEHHKLATMRLVVAFFVLAGVTVVVGPATGDWAVGLTSGWCTAAVLILGWIWLTIGWMDADATAKHAEEEDFDRPSADGVLLAASVASLVSVGFTLFEANSRQGAAQALLIVLTIAAVGLSWATVHTIFTLRYCDLYYEPPVGGIDFGSARPDYGDFAYLAFTIGMTYQVSDTGLRSKGFRGNVLKHALLAYLFGTIIVALVINAVASLLR
jgi:uncharacterized membrane protein